MQKTVTGIKKIALVGLSATLLSFGALTITGCGKSDEEVVREGVARELDQIKNMDPEFIESIAADSLGNQFEAYGIDTTEFMRTYFAGFDYTIDNVTVDGDTAVATVTLTCKSFTEIYTAITDKATELSTNSDIGNMSEDEVNQLIGTTIMDAVGSVTATQTAPVDLTFQLNGNTWEPTASCLSALENALFNI